MFYAIVYPFSDRDLRHRSLDLHVNPLSLYNEANPYLLLLSNYLINYAMFIPNGK